MPAAALDIGSIVRSLPESGAPIGDSSLRLAEAFGWSTRPAYARPIDVGPSVQFTRGFLGSQPAAVFAVSEPGQELGQLNEAALFAYHSSIEWGVVASRAGAMVFNSHRVRDDDWFHLPLVDWSAASNSLDLFEAVTPDGITRGKVERIAARVPQPDRYLLPVDDALVERLDHWRYETFRFTREATKFDEKLQTLFAQMFVLRTVEDRGLRTEVPVPALETAITAAGTVNSGQLRQIFALAQAQIQSDLFNEDVLSDIPEFVLAGILRDVYVPHHLPRTAHRYNFAWIDADVLGRAYEKHLSTVLHPLPTASGPLRPIVRPGARNDFNAAL